MRARIAASAAPSVTAGSTRYLKPSEPAAGSHRSLIEKKWMSRIARKKFGMPIPSTAIAIEPWSSGEFRRHAARIPSGIATSSATSIADRASLAVFGNRSRICLVTGV